MIVLMLEGKLVERICFVFSVIGLLILGRGFSLRGGYCDERSWVCCFGFGEVCVVWVYGV